MKRKTLFILLITVLISSFFCIGHARDVMSDTWVAVDDLGRITPMNESVGNLTNRQVGMFYFVCLNGDDGTLYDTTRQFRKGGYAEVMANVPESSSSHYWNEPYFGYYRTGDPWVIRKHMQMLTDAGVDFIFIDVSNAFIYTEDVTTILDTMLLMQNQEHDVPKVCFLTGDDVDRCAGTVGNLYNAFYSKNQYKDLWFQWEGKPLILADMTEVAPELASMFTARRSWAWNSFTNGGNARWPWIAEYPQVAGKGGNGAVEQVSVACGFHASLSRGRSYSNGKQPDNGAKDFGYSLGTSGLGITYEEQWKRAHSVKPAIVMITGWNEWQAGCQFGATGETICNTWYSGIEFPYSYVDCFSNEFSRDIEPCRNDFKDNYYWQTVSNIRKYKGARAVPAASAEVTIDTAGDLSQWKSVAPTYLDDVYDVTHRDHRMFSQKDPDREQDDFYYEKGGLGYYRNTTGRNDIDEMKVARDNTYVYFYVKCRGDITAPDGSNWLTLFVNTDGNYGNGWLGYDYMINRSIDTQNMTGYVEKSMGGWEWSYVGEVDLQLDGQYLTFGVPREMMQLSAGTTYTLDFKWADNLPFTDETCDPMWFYDMGDTAPNERFNYRYKASFSAMSSVPVDMPLISLDTKVHPNPAEYLKSWLGVTSVTFTTKQKRGNVDADGTYTPYDVIGASYDRFNYIGYNGTKATYRGTVIINTEKNANIIHVKEAKKQKLVVNHDTKEATLFVGYDDPVWDITLENMTKGKVAISGTPVDGKNMFSFFNQKTAAKLSYERDGETLVYALWVKKEDAPEQIQDTSVLYVGDTLPGSNTLWKHTQSSPLKVNAIAALNDVSALTTDVPGNCTFGLKEPYSEYPYVFKYRIFDASVDTNVTRHIAYTNIRSYKNDQFVTDFAGIWFGVLGDKMCLLKSNTSFDYMSDFAVAQLPEGIDARKDFVDVHVLDKKTEVTISVLDANGKIYPLFTLYNIGTSNYTYKNNVTGEVGTAKVKAGSIKTNGYMSFFHHAGPEYYWRNISVGPEFKPIPLEMKSLAFLDATSLSEISSYVTIDNENRTIEAVFNEDASLSKVWAAPVMSINGFRVMIGGKNVASLTHNLTAASYKVLAIGGGATMNYTLNIVRQNAPKIAFANADSVAKFDAVNKEITVSFASDVVPVDLQFELPKEGKMTVDGLNPKFNVFDLRDTSKTHTVVYSVGETQNTYTLKIVRAAMPEKATNTENVFAGNTLPGDNDLWTLTQGANDVEIGTAHGSAVFAPKRNYNSVLGTKDTVAKEFIFEYDYATQVPDHSVINMVFTNIRGSSNSDYITSFYGIWFGVVKDRMYLMTAPRDTERQYLNEFAYSWATVPNGVDANTAFSRVRVVDRGESISLYVRNASGKFVEIFKLTDITGTNFHYENKITGVEGTGFSRGNSIVSPGYISFFHHGESVWYIKDIRYYNSANEDKENGLSSVTLSDSQSGEVVSLGCEINSTVKPFTAKVYVPEGMDVSALKLEAEGAIAGASISGNGTVMNFTTPQTVTYALAGETMEYIVSVESVSPDMSENRKVSAVNLSNKAVQAPMMIAYYDADGRLLSCEVGTYNMQASTSVVAAPVNKYCPAGAASAKLMILSDEIGSIAPMTEFVDFN